MKYLILIHLAYLAIISCDDLCDPEYPDSCGDDETEHWHIRDPEGYKAHFLARNYKAEFIQARIKGGISSDRILNGMFPYVSLFMPPSCMASIIADQWLITAAHCVNEVEIKGKLSSSSVRYGTLDRDKNGVINRLDKIYKHSGYVQFKAKDDIGLLKTKDKIKFSLMVHPIKLSKKQNLQGRLVTLAGFGFVGYPENTYPNTLKAIQLAVLNDDMCKKRQKDKFPEQMCTVFPYDQTQGPCQHDSGASVVSRCRLVGIHTAGSSNCGKATEANLFTQVSEYQDWVEKTTGLNNIYVGQNNTIHILN